METTAGGAIALEAARLAFFCGCGAGVAGANPKLSINSDLSFEQEKAELLAEIWEEVSNCSLQPSELRLGVYREMLGHLAGVLPQDLVGHAEFTIQ